MPSWLQRRDDAATAGLSGVKNTLDPMLFEHRIFCVWDSVEVLRQCFTTRLNASNAPMDRHLMPVSFRVFTRLVNRWSRGYCDQYACSRLSSRSGRPRVSLGECCVNT